VAASALDDLFRDAVRAIDAGDVAELDALLTKHPRLACERLEAPGAWLRDKVGKALDEFFAEPYLLWFVAEDPVRNGKLPANIPAIADSIVRHARKHCGPRVHEQLDYALRLVAWSWIARDSGVQTALVDVLVDAGAALGLTANDALVNSNFAAATHLVERGAPLTLSTALCLERWDDATRLASAATTGQKQFAFILAALKGKVEALRRIIEIGIDVNGVSPDLYSHASGLHHAVSSGSLEAVHVLVDAGADVSARDAVYQGTPLEWAEYSNGKPQYDAIAAYLRQTQGVREQPRRPG
jgi:peptide-methionine (S)-S-oxide reductase